MELLDAVVGDEHEPSCLDPGPLVGRDHIRLHNDGHPGFEHHLREWFVLARWRAEDRREVPAAVAVDEVVGGREPGVFDDRLYLSIRTTNPRADAGRLMRRLLGKRGKGGGHGMMAGGWMPLLGNGGANPQRLQASLTSRLAKYLKKNPERLAPLILDQG